MRAKLFIGNCSIANMAPITVLAPTSTQINIPENVFKPEIALEHARRDAGEVLREAPANLSSEVLRRTRENQPADAVAAAVRDRLFCVKQVQVLGGHEAARGEGGLGWVLQEEERDGEGACVW